jgi:hypothetical protein
MKCFGAGNKVSGLGKKIIIDGIYYLIWKIPLGLDKRGTGAIRCVSTY